VALRPPKKLAEGLRNQQRVLAEFGLEALRGTDLNQMLQHATQLVSEALDVDLVKVLEIQPGGKTMLLRAGVNWAPGVVGHAILGMDIHSPAGYALKVQEPVISSRVEDEKRFTIPQLLKDHGVKSTVNVVIPGKKGPYGVFEVDARNHIDFGADDINFLQNYANIVAGAIERYRYNQELADAAHLRNIMFLELQHRLKNMLMNIMAIAGRTRAASNDLDDFMRSFNARLHALARAEQTLSEISSDAVSLDAILVNELEAHGAAGSDKVVLQGDEVAIPGKDAWALSLVFHELLTNAQKYGALRFESGKIFVSWSWDETSKGLSITWKESGVTTDTKPRKKGFGSQIIGAAIPDKLGGTSSTAFLSDGIEYKVDFPLLPSAGAPSRQSSPSE
jgi:two-component sensor histidine kinase